MFVKAEAEERRLHPRFKASDRALVAVSGDYSGLPYNLIDISMGGMAFLHLSASLLSQTLRQMDIYLNEDRQICSLPVSVVADHKLADYSRLRRRCSVRFGELTEEQRVQLQGFISRHAAAFA